MKKIMKNKDAIIRVLKEEKDRALIIDCIKRTMPKWVDITLLEGYQECSEKELYERTRVKKNRGLSPIEEKVARERFTMIAAILPFLDDEKKRSHMIEQLAKDVSKQTIRKYLCLYLVYQDVAVLAPTEKDGKKELSKDEKNFRWALNKFYYTSHKNSLNTAYTLMLKEKYCDEQGKLFTEYPSFFQFRYYYRKHKSMRQFYISREGIKDYQRNHRPLLGDGVQSFAPCAGTGLLDGTVCDIYLVDDAGMVVGRPILVACIDAFSGLCMGYTLSWEGGVYSLRSLMLNVISNKKNWCEKHGIFINESEWNCSQLPATLVTDMGTEYKSETFEQIAELGIKLVNLPPYRPELKGKVEKFFDLVQESFKKYLRGQKKGVIEPDFKERGGHDYRKDAALTMEQFEQIVLRCIIYYNSKRIVENFPYTEEMLQENVKPFANSIFEWSKKQMAATLINTDAKNLIQVLLPRVTATFKRNGLIVNGLRYKNKNFMEEYLKGKKVTAAYNPEDVSSVWLIENGSYIPFELIESRYSCKTLGEVERMKKEKKDIVKKALRESMQAQIDLAEHIQVISNQSRVNDVKLKNIRDTRRRERTKRHRDFMKAGEYCE